MSFNLYDSHRGLSGRLVLRTKGLIESSVVRGRSSYRPSVLKDLHRSGCFQQVVFMFHSSAAVRATQVNQWDVSASRRLPLFQIFMYPPGVSALI